MALIYSIAGKHSGYARLFYCVLGSATCVFVYFFVRDIFDRPIAFVIGVVAAFYTGLFLYDGWLYTESLYTFCLTGFTYSLFRVQRGNLLVKNTMSTFQQMLVRQRWTISSGLFLAAATLTRPNGSSLLGILVLWACVIILSRKQFWRIILKQIFIIILIGVLLVVPWTYRNYMISHQFVLVATGMGEVLNGAYNDNVLTRKPEDRGYWSPPGGSKIHDEIFYTPEDDKKDTDRSLLWIRSHLSEMPSILGLHLVNMWKPYTYSHGLPIEEFHDRLSSMLLLVLIPIQAIPVFLLALVGFLLTWKRRHEELYIVYLMILFTIGQNVIFYATMRFRSPIEPLLLILVGGALWTISRYPVFFKQPKI